MVLVMLRVGSLAIILSVQAWILNGQTPSGFMAGEIVIKYREMAEVVEIKKFEDKHGLKRIGEIKKIGAVLYSVSEDDVLQKINQIKTEPLIQYVEPNYLQKTYSSFNDPETGNQWYLNTIKLPQAKAKATGMFFSTYVAVIDTGVNKFHSDLQKCLYVGYEKDYVDYDGDADDESDGVGHGTLVAGIIAATQNNALGVAGISDKTQITALRTSDRFGESNQFVNAEAIVQAVDWGSEIINCSFGSPDAHNALYDAISYANSEGVLVVCAAGNDGVNIDSSARYPASYNLPNIISVASSDRNDNLASDSNFGLGSVDIAAPGVDIFNCGINSNRVNIASWGFDPDSLGRANWDGWEHDLISGGGWFEWAVGGLWTRRFIAQYWPNSNSRIKSPLINLSGYHSIKGTFQISGVLGSGDFIYAGSIKGFDRQPYRTFTAGNLTGTHTINIPALDQQSGQIYFEFESDNTGDGLLGLLAASVSGKAADLASNTTYRSGSGTSFAAPVVSGAAAFLKGYMPSKTHLEIKDAILRTARKSSSLSTKVLSGGVLDLDAALSFLLNPGLSITSDLSSVSINQGFQYSYQITANGSPTSFSARGLPAGLKINAKTGLILGIPIEAGSFSVTLQAVKKGSPNATATKNMLVVQRPTFTYPARINAKRNTNLKIKPKIAGSPAPSFAITSGSLPAGLSLNSSTAMITGRPLATGSYPITVRGSNSAGDTDRSTTIVVK